MRGLSVALLLVAFAAPTSAAPVPKAKAKTTEQKLLGKWRLVKSDTDNGVQRGYEFYVTFKEKGELELRYEYGGGVKPQVYTGTYKVIDETKVDYSVNLGGRVKTEVLDITRLTDTDVEWTDPDKLKEELERVKEDEKKDK